MKNYLIIGVLFFFVGCASVPVYTYRVPKPNSYETPDIVAIIVTTLQDSGFNISLVNDKIGIVTTEYLSLTGAFAKGFSKAMYGIADTRRMKISFSVDNNVMLIKMNPVVEEITESYYGAGTPSPVKMGDKEKNKVMKIMKELSSKLSIDESRIEVLEEVRE